MHTDAVRHPGSDRPQPAFHVADWLVQPALNRVSRGDETMQLEPRMMQVLVFLAARPGEVVSRGVLLDEVWCDTVVNEEALTRAVSELRKAFGDDVRAPRFIETIRGSGYRLVAPVAVAVEDRAPAWAGDGLSIHVAPASATPVPRSRRRLLVLGGGLVGLGALLWIGVILFAGPRASVTPDALLAPVPLTSFPGREITPAVSPEGSRIAFAWGGARGDNFDIYVKQANTEEPLRLTGHSAFETYPVWSPDGGTVAFIRVEGDTSSIYAVPAIGGPARRLLHVPARLGGFDWSPGGEALVFAARDGAGGAYRLFRLSLGSQDVTPLTTPPAHLRGDVAPAFSPDGATIAFVRRERAGAQDLFLVPAAGGPARRLTSGQLRIDGLDWADDAHVVFSSYRGGTYSLWRVDVTDGGLTWIPTRGERIYHPSVARTGRLVYEELWYEKNVWRIRRNTGPAPVAEPFIVSTRWDCEAYYAPDGRRLVFTSSRSGHLELWLGDRDGADPVQLTHFEGAFVGNPRWSPDGRRIAFYATPEGSAAVFVMDVEGGRPRRLTDAPWNAWVTGWSRDGHWVYFSSDRSGTWQLWKMPAAGGEPVQVTTDGGFAAAESPDGRFLYYAKPDEPGLWRRPLEHPPGAGEEQVLAALGLEDWGNWTVQDGGIYYVERTGEGPLAVFYDLATKQREPLAPLPQLASPSFAVSPDGQTLLYARIERSESDLMLVDHIW